MNCIFCDISNGVVPGEIIYRDDTAFAILDIAPRAPGHAMVVPRRHTGTILEVPEKDLGALFRAVVRTVKLIRGALAPDGFTIGINQGRASGQAVDHLHIHVIPRFAGDGGGSLHSVVSNVPKESIQDIAKKIRGAG